LNSEWLKEYAHDMTRQRERGNKRHREREREKWGDNTKKFRTGVREGARG
jgi:hypothetical protein